MSGRDDPNHIRQSSINVLQNCVSVRQVPAYVDLEIVPSMKFEPVETVAGSRVRRRFAAEGRKTRRHEGESDESHHDRERHFQGGKTGKK